MEHQSPTTPSQDENAIIDSNWILRQRRPSLVKNPSFEVKEATDEGDVIREVEERLIEQSNKDNGNGRDSIEEEDQGMRTSCSYTAPGLNSQEDVQALDQKLNTDHVKRNSVSEPDVMVTPESRPKLQLRTSYGRNSEAADLPRETATPSDFDWRGEEEESRADSRLPELGTDIDDVMRFIDFHSTERRYLVVGLDYECHMFKDCESMWHHIQTSFSRRKGQNACRDIVSFEPIWVDVQNPGSMDLKEVEKYFHLHPLTTEDCLVNDTGEKWELFEHPTPYMYASLVGEADDWDNENELVQLHVLVFESYVLTVHDRPVKGLNLVLRRIETEFEISISNVRRGKKRPSQGSRKSRKSRRRYSMSIDAGMHVLPESNILAHKYDPLRSHIKHRGVMSGQKTAAPLSELRRKEMPYPSIPTNNKFDSMPVRTLTSVSRPSVHTDRTANVPPYDDVVVDTDGHSEDGAGDSVIDISAITQRKKTEIPSPDWVLYAFLDAMVDIYMPHVDNCSEEVEDLDDLVMELSKSDREVLHRRIGVSKRTISNLRRFLLPKNKIITYLVSKKLKFISSNVQLYLRDVLDHSSMSLEKLDFARENLVQTHSNFMTKTSMEIATSTSRTDDFINRLTIVAVIISPLTLISGLWGMNVKVPGQENDNLIWFFSILGGMVISSLVMLAIFRRQLLHSTGFRSQ